MKKLLICLLFNPALSFCQEIPKYSTTIIAHGLSFQQIKDSLLSHSFFIEQQNESNGTIITKEKNADSYRAFGSNLNRWTVMIYVRIKDSTAVFTEQYSYMEGNFKRWKQVEYWKAKGSVPHSLFMILDNFVKCLTPRIEYTKG